MISKLLEDGYLDAIGDDTAKLDHIRATANELNDLVAKKPAMLPALTLIALDPGADPQDLLLALVQEKLSRHWPTFANRFRNESPVILLRSVILECLSTAATKKIEYAGVIWFTASTPVRIMDLGNESSFLADFVTGVGDRVESAVARQWSYFRDSKPLLRAVEESPDGAAPAAEIDDKSISAAVAALWAADTNSFEIAKSAAVGKAVQAQISSAFDTAVELTVTPLEAIRKLISVEALQNKLLWWKQTKFSETAGRSYRDYGKCFSSFLLAADLSQVVPDLHPHSVEHFLRETAADLGLDEKYPVGSFLGEVSAALASETRARSLLANLHGASDATSSIIGLVNSAAANPGSKDGLQMIFGLDPDRELSLSDLSVWCFQDLQTQRIINRLSGKKRK